MRSLVRLAIRRSVSLQILLAGLILLVPSALGAAESGAIVRVHLRPSGESPAGAVTVTMTSPSQPDRSWFARVEAGRIVTFRNLPAATYHVVVTRDGGSALDMDVQVEAAEIIDLEAWSTSGAGAMPRLEVVNRTREGHGATFFGRSLRDLPSARNLWALLETAEPFVIVDRIDDGGLMTGRSGLVGSRGASWTTMTMSFGDVEVAGPDRTGTVGLVPDLGAVEAVSVTTGMAPVDVAAPGPAIALVPRRPGSSRQGAFAASFTSGGLAGRNDSTGPPSIARLDSWLDANGEVGGPIARHIGAFVSGEATRTRQEARAEGLPLPGDVASFFGHVVANPAPQDEVQAAVSAQRVARAFDGRQQIAGRDVIEHDTFAHLQASWEHFGASGDRRFLSIGYNHAGLTPDVTGGVAGGAVDRVFDGVMPGPPASVTSRQTAITFEFDPRDVRRGRVDHAARLGITFRRASASSNVLALPVVAELVDGLPARVWVNQAPAASVSERHVTDVTAYASDLMQLASRLSLDVGLRADVTTGSAQGAATGVSWKTLAPRVSVRWAPDLVTVFAGYSRYDARLPLDFLAFGDPGEPWAQVYRWNDANGNQVFDPGELGPLVARAGWGQPAGGIDATLRAPHSDEITFGAEHWFGTTLRVHGAATIRHERGLVGAVNIGAPSSSYVPTFILDQGEDYLSPSDDRRLAVYDRRPATFGQDQFLLTNPAGDTARYEGFELTGEVRGSRWYVLVGAMAYLTRAGSASPGFTALENDQGVIGERFANPNAAPFEPGSVFFDRSYVLKWSTVYDAGHDFHVGVSARYQDGQPFTRLVVAPDLAQGPDIIQAYRVGRTRFTYTLTLDAHVEKGFRLGRRAAALSVDIFNLTNQANQVEENPVTGAAFRQTTAVQPPRTVRIGVNVRF